MAKFDAAANSDDLIEKLVSINRVAKVVKGGRIFGFTALTVVGDGEGLFGAGLHRHHSELDEVARNLDAGRTRGASVAPDEDQADEPEGSGT